MSSKSNDLPPLNSKRRLVNSTYEAISGIHYNPFRHPPSLTEAILHHVLSSGSDADAHSERLPQRRARAPLQVLHAADLRGKVPLHLLDRIAEQSRRFSVDFLLFSCFSQLAQKSSRSFSTFASQAYLHFINSSKSANARFFPLTPFAAIP